MLQRSEFIKMCAALGSRAHASDDLIQELENFVCVLYGDQRIGSVDELRYRMFMHKFEKEGKVFDLSLLPPCKANLQLHIIRANYGAFI